MTGCATGGYYREAYPGGDFRGQLVGLLGLSWHEVRRSLPNPGEMPPDHARHLLAELELRPVTDAMIEAAAAPERSDAKLATVREGYEEWRRGLMALLRLAIEKDETLRLDG
jgi:hypothetical protein